MKTACSCPDHRMVASTQFGIHEFGGDLGEVIGPDHPFDVRRWLCGCGDRGPWRAVSENDVYHAWRKHVDKSGGGS